MKKLFMSVVLALAFFVGVFNINAQITPPGGGGSGGTIIGWTDCGGTNCGGIHQQGEFYVACNSYTTPVPPGTGDPVGFCYELQTVYPPDYPNSPAYQVAVIATCKQGEDGCASTCMCVPEWYDQGNSAWWVCKCKKPIYQ